VQHQGWSRVGNRSTRDPRVEFPFGPKLQEVTEISRAEGLPRGQSALRTVRMAAGSRKTGLVGDVEVRDVERERLGFVVTAELG